MAYLPELSDSGRQAVADIAQRHGVSSEAATAMLGALLAGNGSMAQFNHPEFGGSGQWMRGGMTMVSDLFDHGLKARVDSVCRDLARLVADEPGLVRSGSFQSQRQGAGEHGQQQTQAAGHAPGRAAGHAAAGQPARRSDSGHGSETARAPLFVPPAPGSAGNWWPCELGWPDSTGAQNDVRYAYFSRPHRLAIDTGGKVTIYDTLDHHIGGFSQQQSSRGSLSFSSQHGLILLASLPVVSDEETPRTRPAPQRPAPGEARAAGEATQKQAPSSSAAGGHEVCALIEKLADLKAKGILSDEEFARKKAELLSRV